MARWHRLFSRRKRMMDDLDQDIRDYLERETQDNIQRGMPAEEARYAALRKFGNVTRVKEDTWDVWSFGWLEQLWQDVRFGLRQLGRSPGFTAVAVLTLALGIGANTAIFSLIDSVMLRPLPISEPDRLVILRWEARTDPRSTAGIYWGGCPTEGIDTQWVGCWFSYPMFEQMRAAKNVFSAVFTMAPESRLWVNIGGNPSFAQTEFVSKDFFPALGIHSALGRLLGATDEAANASPAVVLSYDYWQRQFGGAPSAIGKSITVNGVPSTVVGVAPPDFVGLDSGIVHDLWLPLSAQSMTAQQWPPATDPGALWLMVGARLKDGVSVAQAEAAARLIFTRGVTSGASPMWKLDDAPRVELVSIAHGLVSLRSRYGKALFLMMGAVGLVLLIACANVASLILVRTAAREKELAIRFALGAARGRIIRQLLTESLIMAAAGGLLGIILAYLGASRLAASFSANWYSPLELNVHPDLRVLAFTMAAATLAGVLFGLAPALRSARIDVTPALKESGASPAWTGLVGRRFGIGNVLVVTQVAFSILVLVGASLLARTLINLATMNIGFDARNVVLFSVQPQLAGYKEERLANLFPELQRRLSALPGVASVGYSRFPLLSGSYAMWAFYFADQPALSADALEVGPNFLETMRLPLLAGRTYNTHDLVNSPDQNPKVVIVNRAFARRLFGTRNPIGRLIRINQRKTAGMEIVGVVGDAKYYSLRHEIEPTAYFLMRPGDGTFEVRTASDPKALIPTIRSILRSVDGNLPVSEFMTQTEQINRTIFQERLVAWLSGAFGLLALVVACIGLYGILAFEVTRRTHEVGVRMALGASSKEVLGLVLGRGIRLAALGVLIGIGASLALTRYLQSLLYGVRPIDPLAYAAVTMLLLIVAFGACYVPARRATKVDPMVALRYE